MPILDGASAVLGRALDELDRRWTDRIARPFGGELNAGEMKSLYAASGGKLKAFRAEALKHFYSGGRATAVIGDRGMPLGPRFRRWMKTAEKVQRSLYPGGGPAPRISARLSAISDGSNQCSTWQPKPTSIREPSYQRSAGCRTNRLAATSGTC